MLTPHSRLPPYYGVSRLKVPRLESTRWSMVRVFVRSYLPSQKPRDPDVSALEEKQRHSSIRFITSPLSQQFRGRATDERDEFSVLRQRDRWKPLTSGTVPVRGQSRLEIRTNRPLCTPVSAADSSMLLRHWVIILGLPLLLRPCFYLGYSANKAKDVVKPGRVLIIDSFNHIYDIRRSSTRNLKKKCITETTSLQIQLNVTH